MAAPATRNLESVSTPHLEQSDTPQQNLGSTALLDIVQACLHQRPSEWIFLREVKVGTGFSSSAAQRLDAFALNCYAHTSMKRVCYEVKTSRADFLCEMKRPLKRRIGLRYSNEFYFVTPAGMLATSEIPIECGLIEIGVFKDDGRNSTLARFEDFTHFNTDHIIYCRLPCRLRREKRPARRGNLWQACCGTSKKDFRRGLPSSQTNSDCHLSTEIGPLVSDGCPSALGYSGIRSEWILKL